MTYIIKGLTVGDEYGENATTYGPALKELSRTSGCLQKVLPPETTVYGSVDPSK